MTYNATADQACSFEETLKRRFRTAASSLEAVAQKLGLRMIGYRSDELPLLCALSFSDRLRIVETLESILGIYSSLAAEENDVSNPNILVWKALSSLNLLPPSRLFSELSNNDVIEIYSFSGLHLFINLKFFEFCSYTLEQIFCLHWTELWAREDSMMNIIAQSVQTLSSPGFSGEIVFHDSFHRIKEIASEDVFEMDFSLRRMIPLMDKTTHNNVAFICIGNAALVNQTNAEITDHKWTLPIFSPS